MSKAVPTVVGQVIGGPAGFVTGMALRGAMNSTRGDGGASPTDAATITALNNMFISDRSTSSPPEATAFSRMTERASAAAGGAFQGAPDAPEPDAPEGTAFSTMSSVNYDRLFGKQDAAASTTGASGAAVPLREQLLGTPRTAGEVSETDNEAGMFKTRTPRRRNAAREILG